MQNTFPLYVEHDLDKVAIKATVSGYLKSKAGVQENTKETYRHTIEHFLDNCKQPSKSAYVNLYIEGLDQEYSRLTVSRRVAVIKDFMKYLNDYDILKNKVFLQVDYTYEYRGGSKSLISDEKLQEILDTCDLTSLNGLRDYALIRLLQSTGMRVGEPLGCKVEDIEEAVHPTGEVRYYLHYTQKRGYRSVVRLMPKTYDAIVSYLTMRVDYRQGSWLFQSHSSKSKGEAYCQKSASRMFRYKLNKVGLIGRRYSTHSLRYTRAIKVLELTGDEHRASQELRHMSPKTIQYYTQDWRNRYLADNAINLEV